LLGIVALLAMSFFCCCCCMRNLKMRIQLKEKKRNKKVQDKRAGDLSRQLHVKDAGARFNDMEVAEREI